MNTIKFDTGIEPPSQTENKNRFRGMKPGESVFLPHPDSKMLHREFKAECKRNNWRSAAEARTENGIAGIRVWRRLEKPRKETGEQEVMQRVAGVLNKAPAAMTIRDIAKNCRPFRRLDADERVQLMEAMVEGGYCTEEKTPRSTAYWYRERQ